MVSESTEFVIGSTMPSSKAFRRLKRRRSCRVRLVTWATGRTPSYLRLTTDAGAWGLAMAVGTSLGTGTAPQRITSDRTIPIGAVADFSDGVRLSLTKDEVRDLPLVGSAPGED